MRILVIGNCQGNKMAEVIRVIAKDASVDFRHVVDLRKRELQVGTAQELHNFDRILSIPLNSDIYGELAFEGVNKHGNVTSYPTITFQGYHPDCTYLNKGTIKSPIGDYHSLITVMAYMGGMSIDECVALYSADTYHKLGYLDVFDKELAQLKNTLLKFDIRNCDDILSMFSSEKAMHTINHPKVAVLDLLVKKILKNCEISYRNINSSEYVVDNFPDSTIFPVYPNILPKKISSESLTFKVASNHNKNNTKFIYDLEEFVSESFKIYQGVEHCQMTSEKLSEPMFRLFQSARDNKSKNKESSHPYKFKPQYCFWNASFRNYAMQEVDPVVKSDLLISKKDKIATAGSCFAQHISRRLAASGYNYYVAELPSPDLVYENMEHENYRTFSARFGNVYTARQLLQLFNRAFGSFSPELRGWVRDDGALVDPFRPQVTKNGFRTESELLADRSRHLAFVREMFLNLDIFVFTLGLTEAWIHKPTDTVLPLAPGVVGGVMDADTYCFHNFCYGEVLADITQFITNLRSVNPTARVLLTVSPVPLAATFEDRHILVSTTASKAILRAVADEVTNSHDFVTYFPSFEIITGNYTLSSYYEKDLREIRPEGVDHVMRLFMKHCTAERPEKVSAGRELSELETIVCDEEALNLN